MVALLIVVLMATGVTALGVLLLGAFGGIPGAPYVFPWVRNRQ